MSITPFKKNTKYECLSCGIFSWNDRPISLEIDHINGNNSDNRIENLRYLCPNCHSQTDTWRGRNKNTGHIKVTDEQLLQAISETDNIRQALIKVGLTPKSLNYRRVSNLLNEKKIDFKNSQYGTIWVNNGSKNKKIKSELLPEYETVGYNKGRIPCYTIPNVSGRIWVNNGIINKMIQNDQPIPEGFWKGRFVP